MIHINLIFQYFNIKLSYFIFGMKTILLRVSIFLLIISSCTDESCKTQVQHLMIVQDDNWTAEYCNEELETIKLKPNDIIQ